MTSQEAFVSALQKFNDGMIMNVVEYIETGKDFCYTFVDDFDDGVHCCVMGASRRMDLNGRHVTPTITADISNENQTIINLFIQEFENMEGFGKRPQSELKRIILQEAEKRGLIKKELEKMEKEIEA